MMSWTTNFQLHGRLGTKLVERLVEKAPGDGVPKSLQNLGRVRPFQLIAERAENNQALPQRVGTVLQQRNDETAYLVKMPVRLIRVFRASGIEHREISQADAVRLIVLLFELDGAWIEQDHAGRLRTR
jgi:hypothetical protein